MKSYIKFKSRFILFFVVLFFLLRGYGCNFPCFNNLNKIPQDENVFRIHINLREVVENPGLNPKGKSKNLFACCFVFRFNDNTSATIYVDTIFESCAPFLDGKQYPCASCINTLILSCPDNIPEIIYLKSLYDDKTEAPKEDTILITSLKSAYEERMNENSWEDPITSFNAAAAIRTTDSETRSIYEFNSKKYLQNKLITKLSKGKKVVAIEFHGCTTFDMCPFCFANMNMVQFLANHNIDTGFLGLLKSLLGNQKLLATPDDIPTTIIISSCRNGGYLHNEKYGWKNNNIMTKKVNQFRIDDNAITQQKLQTVNQIPIKTGRPNQMKKQKKAKETQRKQRQTVQEQLIILGYEIHDVLGDGNCGFYAILQACPEIEQQLGIQEHLNYNYSIPKGQTREEMPQWDAAKRLRQFLFNAKDPLYVMANGLTDPNLESKELTNDNLPYVAKCLRKNILLVVAGSTSAELYTINGNHEIVENVRNVPLDSCICLYYENHHFKAFLPPHK